jgi:phosphocarrier protein HPr
MAFATRTVGIVNERGLHARAAAKFTAVAERFVSDISVSNGRETVPGRSIMGLLLLAAAKETEIVITASGPDAAEAMEALCDLVGRGFDEAPAG